MQMVQMATAIKALARPLFKTGPVRVRVIRGRKSPTPVTAREATAIIRISLKDTQRFIYSSRSETVSFRWGRGR